jgi:hypothetical protein
MIWTITAAVLVASTPARSRAQQRKRLPSAADALAIAALGVWALGAWDAHRAVARRNQRVSASAVVLRHGVGIQLTLRQ